MAESLRGLGGVYPDTAEVSSHARAVRYLKNAVGNELTIERGYQSLSLDPKSITTIP